MPTRIDPANIPDDTTVVQTEEGEVRVVEHHPDQVVCGACLQAFWPENGTIDVVRKSFDDPGSPVCPPCRRKLVDSSIIQPDEDKFKCRCGSKDPKYLDRNGSPQCPIHTSIPSSARVN